jgi:hypothetical protein
VPRRRFDPKLGHALKEGAVWERTRGLEHERTVRIVKATNGALGCRYLVQGLDSGRQWTISPPMLLDTYRPKGWQPT